MKRGYKISLVISIILFALIFYFWYKGLTPKECDLYKNSKIYTGKECTESGGVVKSLEFNECYSGEDFLGRVSDLLCPCICIKSKDQTTILNKT